MTKWKPYFGFRWLARGIGLASACKNSMPRDTLENKVQGQVPGFATCARQTRRDARYGNLHAMRRGAPLPWTQDPDLVSAIPLPDSTNHRSFNLIYSIPFTKVCLRMWLPTVFESCTVHSHVLLLSVFMFSCSKGKREIPFFAVARP